MADLDNLPPFRQGRCVRFHETHIGVSIIFVHFTGNGIKKYPHRKGPVESRIKYSTFSSFANIPLHISLLVQTVAVRKRVQGYWSNGMLGY